MKNFHKTVFIGVLLVFIDINIQAVDIVPDILGKLEEQMQEGASLEVGME